MNSLLNLLIFIFLPMYCTGEHTLPKFHSGQDIPISITERSYAESDFTYLDSEKLLRVKQEIKTKNAAYLPAYNKLIREANNSLGGGPFSVMQKTRTPPSGDKHDYLSLAPYWWPDPEKSDGLPWIRKDGEVNPMTRGENVDYPVKDKMLANVKRLSWAYFFSGDARYAEKTVAYLDTWFVNPATRMNPNLNYAQGVPGHSEGRGFGIIEFSGISHVLTAIEILELENKLPRKTGEGLKTWLTEYLYWLQNSELGLFEASRTNNHGTVYDVQVVGLLLFLNRTDEARAILEAAQKKRIAAHIMPDGTQPEELKRTKSLSYSILNLSALTQLAYFGQRIGVDLWNYQTPATGNIQKAYDFLYPYATGNKTWERQQLGDLQGQVERLQSLFVRTGSMFDKDTYCELASRSEDSESLNILLYPCFENSN